MASSTCSGTAAAALCSCHKNVALAVAGAALVGVGAYWAGRRAGVQSVSSASPLRAACAGSEAERALIPASEIARLNGDVTERAAREGLPVWQVLSGEDEGYMADTIALAARSKRPIFSDFLVAASITYWTDDGRVGSVQGVNSETCVVPSAICAERCALLQLRLRSGVRNIRTVYITTSANALVTPGVLCREFMCEYGPPETRIVLFTQDWKPARDAAGTLLSGSKPVRGQHVVYRLGDLYPYAPIYHRLPRAELVPFAMRTAARMTVVEPSTLQLEGAYITPGSELEAALHAAAGGAVLNAAAYGVLAARAKVLYDEVRALAARPGHQDELYPIHFAAGILFSDGNTIVAREDLCLEYGCTVDAPCKLCVGVTAATDLSSRKSASATASSGVQFAAAAASAGIRPILLLHVDQFGICHALHAKARAWYHEYGYDATTIYVHTQRGSLERLTIGALCPAEPDIDL